MQIMESRVQYELAVTLSEEESDRYYAAFQEAKPIVIPELGWKDFDIDKIEIVADKDGRLWYLLLKQHGSDKITIKDGRILKVIRSSWGD